METEMQILQDNFTNIEGVRQCKTRSIQNHGTSEMWDQKKIVLFPEIRRVNFFVVTCPPAYLNVYQNLYFLFFKKTQIQTKIKTN